MNASTPSPEDMTPDEPRPEELASADQVSHLPPSDSTRSPEELDPVVAEDAARDKVAQEPATGVAEDTGEAEPDVSATGTLRQLPAEDTLESTGGRDLVDEGFNAPDAPGPLYEETVHDQVTGSTLDERLEAEEPDVGQ